jgi:hypothetical protein
MKLNFAETEDPRNDGFELLPNGKYHCQITGAEMSETKGGKAPGTPMVLMEYTIVTGKYENRRVWDNLVLNDASLWKTKALLYALGWTEEEIKSEDFDFDVDELELNGMELDVRIGRQKATEEYEARNKVTGYSAHKTTESDIIP